MNTIKNFSTLTAKDCLLYAQLPLFIVCLIGACMYLMSWNGSEKESLRKQYIELQSQCEVIKNLVDEQSQRITVIQNRIVRIEAEFREKIQQMTEGDGLSVDTSD